MPVGINCFSVSSGALILVPVKQRLGHLLFWICFFAVWKQVSYFYISNSRSALLFTLLDVLSIAVPFYFIFAWAVPRYFQATNRLRFLLASLFAVLVSAGLMTAIMHYGLNSGLFSIRFNFTWDYGELVFNRCFMVVLGAGAGLIVKLSIDGFQNRQRIIYLESEKNRAELESLKAQVNPHFLFNTLNSIYVQMELSPPAARHALHALSHLLHYQLYEGANEQVSLGDEVAYLRHYIALQETRKEGITVQVTIDVNSTELKIAPLLMLNFVENAFKHVARHKNAGWITIAIHTEKNQLLFNVCNSANSLAEHTSKEGIGIANVRKRLHLLYPGKHTLHFERAQDQYSVHLSILLTI